MYRELDSCLFCKSKRFNQIVDLGKQYVADFVQQRDTSLLKAPLLLQKCLDCDLVQLKHQVTPDRLYKKFWYRSGINEQMRTELKNILYSARDVVNLEPYDKVLDIGCNDGTLLSMYPKDHLVTFGIDPCEELIMESVSNKSMTFGISDYFSLEAFDRFTKSLHMNIYNLKFKIITAIAMFYDAEDPVQFLHDCKTLLHDEGVLIIQMNYLMDMIKDTAFDNVCHEHLVYYSVTTLRKVVEAAGLDLQGVSMSPCNGGSVRAFITHKGFEKFGERNHQNKLWLHTNAMRKQLEEMNVSKSFYSDFGLAITSKMDTVRTLLKSIQNMKVYAYGASTRGTVLTQTLFQDGGSEQILGVADRDPKKIGLHMMGTWWPIITEEEFRDKATHALCLPWHFKDSIVKREVEWINRKGGKMIFPLPIPHIMESVLDTEDAVAVRKNL